MSLSVVKARKIVGTRAKTLSDPVIQDLINQLYDVAEIITALVCSDSNQTTMGIESPYRKEQNEAR